jgi:hypothetical protein
MSYVYIYLDPRKTPAEPIYVGKGNGKRASFHKTRANNPILKRKIAKMNGLGLEPIVEIYQDNLSDQEALNLEIQLISKFGRIDLKTGTLCNLTEGGEGSSGRIMSEETKKLWSQQRKGKKQTEAQYAANCNRIISEETRKKQSEANKGRKLSPDVIAKIAKSNTGSKRSEETKLLLSKQRKGKQTGADNPAAIKINIYNNLNELVYTCNGDFKNICKENGLPTSALNTSYRKGGRPIFISKSTPKHILNTYKKFIGWYSKRVV